MAIFIFRAVRCAAGVLCCAAGLDLHSHLHTYIQAFVYTHTHTHINKNNLKKHDFKSIY